MPLFGFRKRKELASKQTQSLPNTTAKSSSPPSTSTAQVDLKGLSANGAKTQEKGKDLCQTNVTFSKQTGNDAT